MAAVGADAGAVGGSGGMALRLLRRSLLRRSLRRGGP